MSFPTASFCWAIKAALAWEVNCQREREREREREINQLLGIPHERERDTHKHNTKQYM